MKPLQFFLLKIFSFLNLKRYLLVFQVMIQANNRRMPFALYISALAVTEPVCLLIGE